MTSVQAGPASRLDVIAPAIARPGQLAQVQVAYTAAVKAAPEPLPEVQNLHVGIAAAPEEALTIPIGRVADSMQLEAPRPVHPQEDGKPIRIRVSDPQREFEAVSNPMLQRSAGLQLFFGDLHGQSQYHCWNPEEEVGISCNSPEECYRYARDIAGLDFCAITDTYSITKDIWSDTVDTAQRMYEPGRFVTFQGTEVGDGVHGDRNVIFAGEDPEPGLKARRCYATTGVRIILETFLDDNPMGSEVPWPDRSKPRQFRISIWGTDELETVTVVKNNEDVHTFRLGNDQTQLLLQDKDEAADGDWCYIRLVQRDGNRAWSSPIWLAVAHG